MASRAVGIALDQSEPVGIIGLGAMGMGVARSLLRSGIPVCGYDLRKEAISQLEDLGGEGCAAASSIGSTCRIALILVVDSVQTEEVLFGPDGLVLTMTPNSVVVTSATVSPGFAKDIGKRLEDRGLWNIDAPLSGGAKGAKEGRLTVIGSGPKVAFDRCRALFSAFARSVYHVGEHPGDGTTIKIINQLLAGVHLATAAEAIAMGLRTGINLQMLYEVITHSAGSSWMFNDRVPRMINESHEVFSAVDILVKDLGLVLDVGDDLSFPLPLTAVARQLLLAAVAAGFGKEDDASVVKIFPGTVDLPLNRALRINASQGARGGT